MIVSQILGGLADVGLLGLKLQAAAGAALHPQGNRSKERPLSHSSMARPSYHVSTWTRGFLRRESGAVLVEHVLWIPFVFLLSVAIADTFLVYLNHAASALILEDATRLLAVGVLPDCTALEATIKSALQNSIPSAIVECSPDDLEIDSQIVVRLTLPAAEMGIGVLTGFVDNFQLPASTIKTFEYFPGI